MRAITDWYFTAHPPIMHDLHEAQPLMYTYSGGPPQNPNLDPLLFAELPFFSNWEMAQMTKWGMPGVYTHAFMDGWSPGLPRLRRLQPQRHDADVRDAVGPWIAPSADAAGGARRRLRRRGSARVPEVAGGGGDARRRAARGGGRSRPRWPAAVAAARWRPWGLAACRPGTRRPPLEAAVAAVAAAAAGAIPTGRGGGQPREWYRGIPIPPGAAHFSRRNNTNYMETGVLSALQLTSMFPNIVLENFYIKTRNIRSTTARPRRRTATSFRCSAT